MKMNLGCSELFLACISFCILVVKAGKLSAQVDFFTKFVGGNVVPDAPAQPQVLSVIGAGFSRSGTKSIEAALVRLGQKVYDFRSMVEHDHGEEWVDCGKEWRSTDELMRDQNQLESCQEVVKKIEELGFTATLDSPMNLFAPILSKLRPEAKVLYSVRDEDALFDSYLNVVRHVCFLLVRPWSWLGIDPTTMKHIFNVTYGHEVPLATYPRDIVRPVPWYEYVPRVPGFEGDGDRERWIRLYRAFAEELHATVTPLERLLTFHVRDGWAPLLKFLEIDDPKLAREPFPWVNDTKVLVRVARILNIVGLLLPVWICLITWASFSLIRLLARKIAPQKQKRKVK